MKTFNQKGEFTIHGLMGATAASIAVFLVIQSFLSVYTGRSSYIQNQSAAQWEIANLHSLLQRDIATRYRPAAGEPDPDYQLVSGSSEEAPADCDGIEIFRRHLENNTIEKVRYETVCIERDCTLASGSTYIAVSRWLDSSKPEFTRITFGKPGPAILGGSLCMNEFSESAIPTELRADIHIYHRGKAANATENSVATLRWRAPLNDRFDGVELAP